jgi:serine/threonine protein phosphatase PrpC
MEMMLHWSGMTHPGRFRKNNEDAFLGMILYPKEAHYLGKEGFHAHKNHEFIFAVSDGMGGANSGEFASKIALESVSKRVFDARPSAPASHETKKQFLEDVMQLIHASIHNLGRSYEECKGMGATLSLVWIEGNDVTFAHIGDSRIYHIPSGQPIEQISEDHSEVGRLHRAGKINERQSKTHPERHILDQALGGNIRKITPQVGSFKVDANDHIVLCSDGINDGLFNRSIEKTIITPPFNLKGYRASERLIKEAMFSSGRDNLTAMVIQLQQSEQMPLHDQPE